MSQQQTNVPLYLAVVVTSVVTLLLLSSLLQVRINARNKQQCRNLAAILICLLLEFVFDISCIISITHSELTRSRRVQSVQYIVLIMMLCSTSYIAYALLKTPQIVKYGIYVKRLWQGLSVLQILWLIFCVVGVAMRTAQSELWQHMYFVGLYAYVMVGSCILIYVTYYIRSSIQSLVHSAEKRELGEETSAPAADGAITKHLQTTESQIGGITGTQLSIITHPGSRNPMTPTRLRKLQHALRQLNRTLCMLAILVLLAGLTLAWRTSVLAHYASNAPSTLSSSDTIPFNSIAEYVLHYVLVFLLYAASTTTTTTNISICIICSCKPNQQEADDMDDANPHSPAEQPGDTAADPENVDSKAENKPASIAVHVEPHPTTSSPAGKRKRNRSFINERFLDVLDDQRHAELYDYVVRSQCKVAPLRHSSNTLALSSLPADVDRLEAGGSMPEHSQLSKNALSTTHLRANLNAIDLDGHILGKRGANKINRIKGEEIERRKQEFQEEKTPRLLNDARTASGDSPTTDDVDNARKSSVTTMPAMSKPPSSGNQNTPSTPDVDSLVRLVENIVDDMSEPVRVVVMELDRVLCTQNGQQLRNKNASFVESLQRFKQQLYFGGQERLQMLQRWLESGIEAKVKFYVISGTQSKMLLSLLFSVDLLKFFVSINPGNNDRKLLSHVIGYDHRIYQEQGGKRHLMLLKFLRLLQQPHASMLYIGHDTETIQHIANIDVCKTYHVESGALVHFDLQQISDKYFTVNPEINE